MNEFAKNLKHFRENVLKISISEFCRLTKTDPASISRYERNLAKPSIGFCEILMDMFSISANWLIFTIGEQYIDKSILNTRLQLLNDNNIHLFYVKTDEMLPSVINGDVVATYQVPIETLQPGNIYVIINSQGDEHLARLGELDKKFINIHYDHSEYTAEKISIDQVERVYKVYEVRKRLLN